MKKSLIETLFRGKSLRLLLPAVFVAILLLPMRVVAPALAQESGGVICFWQSVSGQVDASNRENEWLFSVDESTSVLLKASTTERSNLDPVIELVRDDTGVTIRPVSDLQTPRTRTRLLGYELGEPGTYRVVVRAISESGPGSNGPYSLTLEPGIPPELLSTAISTKSATRPLSAGMIFDGDIVYGTTDRSHDKHVWFFQGLRGNEVTIIQSEDVSDGLAVELYDATGNRLGRENWERIQHVLPQTDWYFIVVTGEHWRESVGDYWLSLVGNGAQRSQAIECPTSALTPQPSGAGESPEEIDISNPPFDRLGVAQGAAVLNNAPSVEGAVANNNVIQPYVFAANKGDAITVRMMRTSGNLIPLLGMQDMAGLLDRAPADLSGRQATLSITIPETGWYAVLATREGVEDGITTGDFLLTFEGSTVAGSGPPDIGQPATVVAAGQTLQDEITGDAFVAYYLINAAEGQGFVITMNRASGNLEPFVAMMNTELDVLVRGRPNLAGTESALAFKAEEGGWYVIAATRADFDEGTTTGEYTLEVKGQ